MNDIQFKNAEVFIIEDDENTSEFMRTLLENEGYICTIFPSGNEGVQALKAGRKADIVLLDLMMEGMDGYEVCKTLRSDMKLKFVPIIIISGKSSIEERVLGLRMGADDFLVKPFKNKELLAKIQVLLRIKKLQDQLINVEGKYAWKNAAQCFVYQPESLPCEIGG